MNELTLYFDHEKHFTGLMLPACLSICSSESYFKERSNFRNNEVNHVEKKSCMQNCAWKFDQAEKHCIKSVQNHSYYYKNFGLNNKLKLEEDKKVESLIHKLF